MFLTAVSLKLDQKTKNVFIGVAGLIIKFVSKLRSLKSFEVTNSKNETIRYVPWAPNYPMDLEKKECSVSEKFCSTISRGRPGDHF